MARLILAHAVEVMDRPWKWGEADCCTSACDVFARITGIDPMARLRGTYNTRVGAAAMIRAMGGFDAMVDRLAAEAGLTRGTGDAGEIGIGVLPNGRRALTVSVARAAFVGKSPTGLAAVPEVLRSYRA